MGNKVKKNILRIAFCAISIALFVALDAISIKAGPFKFSVSGFPIIFIAILFGPIDGLLVGLIGAFIGQLIGPYGLTPTTVLWILPAGIRGLFVGFLMKNRLPLEHKVRFIITIIISSLIVTAVNTLVMYIDAKIFDYYTYGYVFGALLYRVLSGVIISIVYIIVTPLILKPFQNRLFKKDIETE